VTLVKFNEPSGPPPHTTQNSQKPWHPPITVSPSIPQNRSSPWATVSDNIISCCSWPVRG